MAVNLSLRDTHAVTALVTDPAIGEIMEPYFREKANKFGAAQPLSSGLQGQGIPSKKPKEGTRLIIQVGQLFALLNAGDLITKSEIDACPHLPLPTDHAMYGTATAKMAQGRKMASTIYTLVRLKIELKCLQAEATTESPFLLDTTTAEDFWRAYQFLLFYETNRNRGKDPTINTSAKEATGVHYLTREQKYQGTHREIVTKLSDDAAAARLALLDVDEDEDGAEDSAMQRLPWQVQTTF